MAIASSSGITEEEKRDWTDEACSGGEFSANDKSKSPIDDHACIHMANEFELVVCFPVWSHTPIDVGNCLFEIRPTIGQERLWSLELHHRSPHRLPQHPYTPAKNIQNDSNQHRNRPQKDPNSDIFYRIFELLSIFTGSITVFAHDPDTMVVLR